MKKWLCGLTLVAFPLLQPVQASELQPADNAPPALAEVVVTGSRVAEPAERIPANVTVIDREALQNSNAQNVAELLRSEQGIVVRDLLGNGKTAQVDLRGFGETGPYNNLVLVDGRRVNEIDLSGVDWTQIPLEQVERIEIVRGTGSVLYGDNAVGGVINIITKLPPKGWSASVNGSTGSFGSHKERFELGGGGERLRASLFGSYQDTDGYRRNNDFRAGNIGGKILADPVDFLGLRLSGSHHSDDYGLPGPLSAAELSADRKGSTAPNDKAETEDSYLDLGFDVALGALGDLILDLSFRTRESESDWTSLSWAEERETETLGAAPRYVLSRALFGRPNKVILGLDVYRSEQDVTSYFGAPLAPSGIAGVEKSTYGFYAHDELSLSDAFILSLGARRESVEYDFKQRDLGPFPLAPLSDSLSERENAYSAGLTWLYGSGSSLFARVNRSFRFPLVDELVIFDYVAGRIRVNDDLKPQAGTHYELGVKHVFAPGFEGRLTFFRAEIKDEIFFNPATFFNENHPETLHQGMEIGGQAALTRHLSLNGSYTYQKATFERDPFRGNDVPAVPRQKASLGLSVSDIWPGLVLSAAWNYVGTSYLISDQANGFDKLDSYHTLDARLSYTWKWLKAFAGASNLTGEKYSPYGVVYGFPLQAVYYPAPERQWFGGIEFIF